MLPKKLLITKFHVESTKMKVLATQEGKIKCGNIGR